MIKKIICYFLGHKYFKMKVFDISTDEEGYIKICERCNKIKGE